MAHLIESIMYVGETPWHKIGTKLDKPPTSEDAIVAAGLNQLFLKYKNTAIKLYKKPFDLSLEEFKRITSGKCFYCGSDPVLSITNNGAPSQEAKDHARYKYNGIDRKNNDLGYIDGNCLSCCFVCNRMKLAYEFDFFVNHIKKIERNLK